MNSSDLDKAWKIVSKRKSWVGSHGQLQKNIADAVVEEIALGRKDGLKLAKRLIEEHDEGHEGQQTMKTRNGLPSSRPHDFRV